MRTRAKLALAVVLVLVAAVPAFAATAPTGKTAAQIRAYYDSGLWRKAVKKQVNRAKGYIIKRTEGRHKAKRAALVLDIDDTSLNNYPCLNANGGIPYSAGPYATCVVKFNAPATNSVHSLFIFAKQHGVKVFFITARPEGIRDGTLQNLRAAGYKGKYELFLQPGDYTQDSKIPYKSGVRKQIEQRGFHIIANVGDQQSDLKGGYSERTFKLPNQIYLTS
jgi:predicted secreted acid phosphatase